MSERKTAFLDRIYSEPGEWDMFDLYSLDLMDQEELASTLQQLEDAELIKREQAYPADRFYPVTSLDDYVTVRVLGLIRDAYDGCDAWALYADLVANFGFIPPVKDLLMRGLKDLARRGEIRSEEGPCGDVYYPVGALTQ